MVSHHVSRYPADMTRVARKVRRVDFNLMTEKLAATDPGSVARIFDWLRRFGGVAVFAAVVLVLLALARHLARDIDYHALLLAVRHMSNTALGESVLATLVSFLALIGRDVVSLAQARLRPPASAVILAGFCGTALGNAVGFGTLTGGAVRYRIYGAVGVKPDQIGRVMVYIAVGFGLGLLGFTSTMVLVDARVSALLLRWPVGMLRDVAVAGLVLTALAVWLCAKGRLKFGRLSIDMPMPMLLVGQIALTGLDLIAAAAALWVLLPAAQLDFVGFTVVFSVATAIGVISHIPGGLGVFEAVVAFSLGRNIPPDHIAAALLAYRGIYFVLPLLLSALLLAGFELRLRAMAVQSATGLRLARSAARLTPVFVAVITFVAGIMLVVSGATPSFTHRLAALSNYVPLWVVEASHFLGSLTGVLLLFVARGLLHRLDGAWFMAVVLSIASLGLSLAKGLAYGEIGVFSVLILLLIMTRRQFHRPATLMDQAFTAGWFVAVAIIVASSFWILHFAFEGLHYSRDLLWQFEFDAQAPRAARATVGVAILALSLALLQLLRPPKGFAAAPSAADLARAQAILRTQNDSAGYLALMGDKSLMFSGSGQAFLMFARRGRSWIALFDPVGPRAEATELIWRFVELAASHGGRAAFYQIRPETLPLYLDAGLKIMKLGEEAVVKLDSFNLSGPKQAKLRYALSRGERDGLSVTLYPPEQVNPLLPVLEIISTDWLKARRVAERGFSVASFKASFIATQWVALLQQHNRPVAFVTVMTTETRQRATLGLMRHVSEASPYAMEFLFGRVLLAFKEAGFHELSLGMAPLSGIEAAPLSSRWHRLGALLHRHGGFIYNFQGLRLFKSKFSPVWEPRYLAASGTVSPFFALADVAALAGGGKGISD